MDIFVIDINNFSDISHETLGLYEKKKYTNKEKWRIHCLAYYYLDKILDEKYKIQNRELVFVNGKPKLRSNEKFFSISHSGNMIAFSFSDYNCGIDIEIIKERDYKSISERMGFEVNSLVEFYEAWTEFEANYKLSIKALSKKSFEIKNYILTAVSVNKSENFEISI